MSMVILEVLQWLAVLGVLAFFALLLYLGFRFIGWFFSGIGENVTRMSGDEAQMEVWKGERRARDMSGGGNSAWDTAAFNLAKKKLKDR